MKTITDVKVKLAGTDGNAFSILGKVSGALRRAGYKKEAEKFVEKATSGDYAHLLRVCGEYVIVS